MAKRYYREDCVYHSNPHPQKVTRKLAAQLVQRAKTFHKNTKVAGSAKRCISLSALEVYKIIVGLATRGPATPSVDFLCNKTTFSRSTVFRCLKALKACGLVSIIKRKDERWINGHMRTCQTTNLYQLKFSPPIAVLPVPVLRKPPNKATGPPSVSGGVNFARNKLTHLRTLEPVAASSSLLANLKAKGAIP